MWDHVVYSEVCSRGVLCINKCVLMRACACVCVLQHQCGHPAGGAQPYAVLFLSECAQRDAEYTSAQECVCVCHIHVYESVCGGGQTV